MTAFDLVSYKKDMKDLGSLSDTLESSEKTLGALMGKDIEEPDMDVLAERNPPPFYIGLITLFGWLLAIASLLLGAVFWFSGMQLFYVVLLFAGLMVSGFILAGLGWSMRILNRIMVVNQYQAELLQYQHHIEQINRHRNGG